MQLTAAKEPELFLRIAKEERLRRLKEEWLRYYEPLPKQLLFHKSQAQIRGFGGPNKGGKSVAGTMEILLTVGKVHPWRPNYTGPVYARDCCQNFSILSSTLLPLYRESVPRNPCILQGRTFEGNLRRWPGLRGGHWDKAFDKEERILYLADGSFIEFKSYDQYRKDPDSFEGPVRHIIRHDEEPPQGAFSANLARQMTVGTNILFTLTPIHPSQWLAFTLYEQAAATDKVEIIEADISENPFIDPDVVAMMESQITDPAEKMARLHGKPSYFSGRIWKEYGEHNLIDEQKIPPEWPRIVAIDPHPEKPTAVNWIAVDPYDKRMYIYREADIEGDVEKIATEIKKLSFGEPIKTWIMDPSSLAGAAIRGQGSLYDEFLKYIPTLTLGDNSKKEQQRDMIRQMVKNNPSTGPRLFVMRCCPRTHHQMLNYSWAPPPRTGLDRSKPRVYKKNDDHPDCVLLAVSVADVEIDGKRFDGFNVRMYAN